MILNKKSVNKISIIIDNIYNLLDNKKDNLLKEDFIFINNLINELMNEYNSI